MAKEQKITIISTMRGASWGGSEELWYRTVRCGQATGQQFSVHLFDNGDVHAKAKELQQLKNVELQILGERTCIIPPLPMRIFYKLLRKPVKIKYVSRYSALEENASDIVLLSLGDLQEICYFEDLYEFLLHTSKKLVVLVQYVAEFGFIANENRQRILLILQKATNVLFVAERNKITTERMLVKPLANARIIRNPLNLQSSNYIPYPSGDKLRIAVVSRLQIQVKGQDILLQLLAQEKWRNRKVEVHFFGTGAHADYLQQLITFYQLENHVQLKGHVAEVRTIWEKYQLLVLPSRSEGTPLSLVEAMVCGRAAVVTDVGDCARLVQEGITGFVANAATEKSLDDALEKAWQAQDKLEVMGKTARVNANIYLEYPAEQALLDYLNKL